MTRLILKTMIGKIKQLTNEFTRLNIRMHSLKLLIVAITLQVIYIIFNNVRNTNNVCRTFEDYYTDRDSNKNCYYNPDYRLTVTEIIQRHGYPLQIHYVTTVDGHILTLYRIPHGRNHSSDSERRKKPVLLQHGFIANCAGFVNIGEKSLGFLLANQGYDVWLGNFRGYKYSRNHISLTTSDSEYWNFTVHENGVYDLPALVDFIANTTNQKIIFIGFSLGTSALYIYSTTYPDIAANNIELSISMAPAAFMGGTQSLVRYVSGYWKVMEILGMFIYKIDIPEIFTRYACHPYPFQTKLCYFPINFVSGFNYGQQDPENILSSVNHLADSIHIKTFLHVIQMVMSDEFKPFDYGPESNLKLYGTKNPPIYNLSKIAVPTYLIRAENDLLLPKRGVEKLHGKLPKSINQHDIYVVPDQDFSHMDFLNGRDVVPLLYNHLLDFIKNNSKIKL